MITRVLSNLASFISRALFTALLSGRLSEEILYWHRSRLYWEGVTHPDGGHREDQANIELAEGAAIAFRRIADGVGLSPASLPTEEMARSLARLTLKLDLDEKESAAIKTITHLGPSRSIPLADRMRDHIEASEAEEAIEHSQLIREYLHWLDDVDDAQERRRNLQEKELSGEV
jgi:hypothetical protein